jgi:hypothetical protein
MKILVKEKSGLSYDGGGAIVLKSFADCSKDELVLAIQACIEIGELYNINLS